MTNEQWQDVEDLYGRAVDLGGAERARLLDERRAVAPEVVAEVESLLAAGAPADTFLSSPWLAAGPEPSLAGRTIGPFRLVEPIGSGGMGVVYRAEREEAGFAQQVAIKVITAARWHRASLRQFKAERQLLATLHHPHIVTLMDGGITDDGLAYLVMEFVDGVPITEFCRSRPLSLPARLALVQQVCTAVQHAHRHAIVHRDLKPANILVTRDSVPKVLDFGIARLLEDPAEGPLHTATGWLRALTPNYASPEQIRGLPASAADDVYALGVLLFELLTGRAPYQATGRPLDEVLRMVVERPVPRPSTAVAPDAPVRASQLAGNLDAIILKALDKDPARRYGSAQELADDLGRHLAGQVVIAREPSFAYVLATLARRHRALVAATVVSLAAVLAALGVSIVQTRRAVVERDRADQRFADVRRLANALIFDIHDAVQPLPGSTPVRQRIVAEALTYLESLARDTSDDELRLELGLAYQRIATVQGNPTGSNLGDREGAVDSYRKAIALLSAAAARSTPAAVALTRTQFSLVGTLSAMGRRDEALEVAREAQLTAEGVLSRDGADAEARRLLGTAYFWQATMSPTGREPQQSIPLWTKAGEVFESLLAEQPDDPDRQRNVALVAKYLGEQYRQVGDLENALVQHQRAQAIDDRRVARAPESRQAQLDLALDWSSLSGVYRELGRLPEAAAAAERSLATREALSASDPKDDYLRGRLAHAHAILGSILGDLNRYDEAIGHLREAVRVAESRAPRDVQERLDLVRHVASLSDVTRKSGRTGEACAHLQRASRLLAAAADGGPEQLAADPVRRLVTDGLASCAARRATP